MKTDELSHEMKRHCIAELKLHADSNEGYYKNERYTGRGATIPDGPWWVGEKEPLPSDIRTTLHDYGCAFDKKNRPLHPWYKELLATTGLVSGTGEFWHWGPNYTADPVVITREKQPKLLLIQRRDNGRWAFAGGFIDENEMPVDAARREAREETGVDLSGIDGTLIYDGVVADDRNTAHAWAHTHAFLFRIESTMAVAESNETLDVGWFNLDEIPASFQGSHKKILDFAQRVL